MQFSKAIRIIGLLSLACLPAVQAATAVKISKVTIYNEYSTEKNEFQWKESSRVYVFTFDHAVRNRDSVLDVTVNGKTVGLPIRPAVGTAYDSPTTQLEARAWDMLELGNEQDTRNIAEILGHGQTYNSAFEIAAVKALEGQPAKLNLLACPTTFDATLSVVNPEFTDPRYNTTQKFILLKTTPATTGFAARGLWMKIQTNEGPAYAWMHTGDNSNNASTFGADVLEVNSKLFGIDLTPQQIRASLEGQHVGLKYNEGALPPCYLPDSPAE